MANLTLRQTAPGSPKPNITYKGAPLSHVELDGNFTALDSSLSQGHFDSGIDVDGGIIINDGGLTINDGDLVLNDANFHYNPKLKFYDQVAATNTMILDSTGSLLVGTENNGQGVKFKVARTGNQHTLVGSLVSNSGQITRSEMGPAGGTADTGAGVKATQVTSNFSDWSLSLFASNSTDGYVDGLTISKDGNLTVHKDATFEQNVTIDQDLDVTGDVDITGDLDVTGNILNNGSPIAGGTVSSVAMTVPTGLAVSGSPITTSGTLALSMQAGYSIPLSSKQTQWDTAYGWGDHGAAGYLTASRNINTSNGIQGGGDLTADRSFSLSGSYTGTWSVTGAITATGDVTAFSDIAIKEDIVNIDGALDKVSQLGGYVFKRKDDDTRKYTGVIAQEVHDVLPEAVHGVDGKYSVAYGNMVGLLIEAIKELKAEVEELKKG